MAKKKKDNFRRLLGKYLEIKGLDIVVLLNDGREVELNKNRELIKNEIIFKDRHNNESRIALENINSIDFFAA